MTSINPSAPVRSWLAGLSLEISSVAALIAEYAPADAMGLIS
jgi:hypothetical protein